MFLITTYIQQPDTKLEKGQYTENVSFARKVRNTDLARANVILDLVKQQVIKCRLNGQTDNNFREIFYYFYSHYTKDIDKLLGQEYAQSLLPVKDSKLIETSSS